MRQYSPNSSGSQSGAALVIVLSFVMLLTVVVLTYLSGTTQEMTTSKSYSELARTRVLATTALELVKAQIWAATTETNSGAAATSWASQPGAIRTFKSGDTNLVNVYKLYSSDSMVVANSGYTPASEVPANWASRPNEYVDLNRPVVVAGVTNYPILSPDSTNGVAGFSITNATGATTTSRLPMPVQWIYVLRDGSLTNSSVATAAFNSNNPIVGRIAFWTDDDTCKININTAGAVRDGETNNGVAASSFWDISRGVGVGVGNNNTEANMARFQMAQREYQRYPGHPARVNLRTVLTNMTASQIYDITPRITSADTNGSFGGTRVATNALPLKTERLYATLDELFYATNRSSNSAALTSANLNSLEGFLTAYNRAPELNLFGRPRVSMWPLNGDPAKRLPMDEWFATCSSMAYGSGGSGTNLFSVTRSDSTSPTADLTFNNATIPKLFKYLQDQTSIAPPGYADSFSSKYGAAGRDQLITLSLDYIRCVNLYDSSVLPGQPGYSTYVRNGTKVHNTNAFTPGTLAERNYRDIPYTTGYGQVVPLIIGPAQVPTISGSFKGLGRMDTTISEAALHFWALSWDGSNGSNGRTANPVREDDQITIGGVTDTVKNFAANPANFYKICQVGNPVTNGTGAPMYAAQVLVSPFNPMMGYCNYNPNYFHKISGLSGLSVTTSLGTFNIFSGAPDPGFNMVKSGGGPYSMQGGGGRGFADTIRYPGQYGIGGKLVDFSQGKGTSITNASMLYYPFASQMFAVPDSDSKITLGACNLSLEILSPGGSTIQKLALNFPGALMDKPLPYLGDIGPSPAPAPTDGKIFSAYYGANLYGNPLYGTLAVGNFLANGRRMRTMCDNPNRPAGMVASGDVVLSMEANGPATDYRWLSLQQDTSSTPSLFKEHLNYASAGPNTVACGLRDPYTSTTYITGIQTGPVKANAGTYLGNASNNRLAPFISSRYAATGVTNSLGKAPDFETGSGDFYDGAFARKPDEGVLRIPIGSTTPTPAYYSAKGSGGDNSQDWNALAFDLFFAPNRQVPSPGIMGGLPSRGTEANGAWETLLFCPNPAAGTTSSDHRGFVSPPDYLWMDLFTMPIVEPYAISEPFSTAGKVNMNYQIVPFTYVTRSTGMRAVLAANRVSAISSAVVPVTDASSRTIRYPIHLDETLKQFQARFDGGQIFKSPSEICSMWLYPGQTNAPTTALLNNPDSAGSSSNIRNWWYNPLADAGRKFTGDNLREQPYTALYQNLTTQANTYTVHVCSQSLAQAPSGKLTVTGEYRGSYALERFLDPKAPTLPDFTSATSPNAMAYYQFRVNGTKQFVP